MTDEPRTFAGSSMTAEAWRDVVRHGHEIPRTQAHELVTELLDEIEHLRSVISDARNAALERAAQECESMLTRHGERKGGSDTGDAARRMCATRIRMLKTPEAPK